MNVDEVDCARRHLSTDCIPVTEFRRANDRGAGVGSPPEQSTRARARGLRLSVTISLGKHSFVYTASTLNRAASRHHRPLDRVMSALHRHIRPSKFRASPRTLRRWASACPLQASYKQRATARRASSPQLWLFARSRICMVVQKRKPPANSLSLWR